jgi:hypothetical protein
MVKWTFKKFKRLRQANASFFFKNTLEIFCYCFESEKPSGDQIREMIATAGFVRFHMESPYRCYSNEKVVDMPKSRAQFTPMHTTAADSRTKLFITLDTKRRPNPVFYKQTVLEQRIGKDGKF